MKKAICLILALCLALTFSSCSVFDKIRDKISSPAGETATGETTTVTKTGREGLSKYIPSDGESDVFSSETATEAARPEKVFITNGFSAVCRVVDAGEVNADVLEGRDVNADYAENFDKETIRITASYENGRIFDIYVKSLVGRGYLDYGNEIIAEVLCKNGEKCVFSLKTDLMESDYYIYDLQSKSLIPLGQFDSAVCYEDKIKLHTLSYIDDSLSTDTFTDYSGNIIGKNGAAADTDGETVGCDSFTVTVPASWSGKYTVKTNTDSISFYHRESRDSGCNGFLFGLTLVSQFPQIMINEAIIGKLGRYGQVFWVMNTCPGDFQAADGFEDEFSSMLSDKNEILRTVESTDSETGFFELIDNKEYEGTFTGSDEYGRIYTVEVSNVSYSSALLTVDIRGGDYYRHAVYSAVIYDASITMGEDSYMTGNKLEGEINFYPQGASIYVYSEEDAAVTVELAG